MEVDDICLPKDLKKLSDAKLEILQEDAWNLKEMYQEKFDLITKEIYERKTLKFKKPTKHGWTKQESRCKDAVWWDCSFLCTNKKLNPKKGLFECKLNVPDSERCKGVKK